MAEGVEMWFFMAVLTEETEVEEIGMSTAVAAPMVT
jgi:hypothetical protein